MEFMDNWIVRHFFLFIGKSSVVKKLYLFIISYSYGRVGIKEM